MAKQQKPANDFSPFEFVKSITTTKINKIQEADDSEYAEKEYVPFVVNRALALYVDTVLYANDMNMYPQLDKKLQYDYLLNSIRKSARYAKWVKSEGSEDIEAIKTYFKMNDEKARQALSILTADQLKTIKNKLDTGGS